MLPYLLLLVVAARPEGSPTNTPAIAVRQAAADVALLPNPEQWRYVYIPQWMDDTKTTAAISYAFNATMSRTSNIIKPVLIHPGLVRINVRALVPREKDFETVVLGVYEGLANDDPYFHIKIGKAIAYPTYLDTQSVGLLAKKCVSNAFIFRADWLVTRMLSQLDGGRYYELAGVERKPAKGTAQEAFINFAGASEKDSERLDSDLRVGMFFSDVTGKPRRVDTIHGRGSRVGTGQVWITHDTADGDDAVNKHPLLNLLQFEDKAREIIVERNNGLHIFGLFDGSGNLQDSAPDNVVRDSQIPAPFTNRLEPGISCIRCHATHDGLKPLKNDVARLLKPGEGGVPGLDVFDDLARADNVSPAEVVDRLAGLYGHDFSLTKKLERGRDDYAEAVHQLSGGMTPDEMSKIITAIFRKYRYNLVGPDQLARELGYEVGKGDDGLKAIQWLLPPLPADRAGLSPEDGRIGAIRHGISLTRADAEKIYADAARRSNLVLEKLQWPSKKP